MGWVEHVVCMGEIRRAYRIFVGRCEDEYLLEDVKKRHLFEELGIDERKILKSGLE